MLAGTDSGVYRVPERRFEGAEQVLGGVGIRQLDSGDGVVFAASGSGVIRSTDGGKRWETVGPPVEDVHAVTSTERGVYAGVQPARLYVSDDSGETWTAQAGFEAVAAGSSWPNLPDRTEACVRDIAVVDDTILVGVEVGGLVVSTDGGASFEAVGSVPADVHHVLAVGSSHWIVSCGTGGPGGHGGVFETTTAGDRWVERDIGTAEYVRESCYRDCLYTAANETAPLWDPPDATLFAERDGTLAPRQYPGGPESYVISWATGADHIFAGTNDGAILRGPGEWERLGTVPVSAEAQRAWGVRSLTVPTVKR
ncbi:MAG: hypothetical protein ACI8TL_001972 [Natronomonas sp.]|jgi:hypothetical protein